MPKARADRDTDTDTKPLEGPLKWIDMTSTERHINRSIKIRRAISRFISQNEGQLFDDPKDLGNQAANYAKCGYEAAWRWLDQFTAKDQPYVITEQAAGLVIMRRPGREQA